MITRTLTTAATLAALLATPALAQHPHGQHAPDSADATTGGGMHMMRGSGMQMMQGSMMGGSMGMTGGGMMGMMQSMHPGPGMILAAADDLELTDDQRDRLRTLREQSMAQHRGHMQAAMATRRQASEALAGDDPDLDAYEEALREAAEHMVQGHLAMATTALQARDILTPAQREQLQGALSMMHRMRGGMMDGGMMGEPMQGMPGGSGGPGAPR